MVELLRHRQTKGPGTDRLDLNHRATPRLYMVHPACPLTTSASHKARNGSPLRPSFRVSALAGCTIENRPDSRGRGVLGDYGAWPCRPFSNLSGWLSAAP